MATIGSLVVELRAKTTKFAEGLASSKKQMRNFGLGAQDVGRTLTAGLTLPIAGIAIAATKMASDFNESMANVATLIPGSTERINELKKAVQDTAVVTGTSTADISEGLFQLVSAFGDSADSAKQLELAAIAAKAGNASVAESIDLVSAVTKGYGDTSLEAQKKVFDLAFTTNRLGKTTFPELAASLGKVIPLAENLKVSQEELFAVMATATGVTGNTAEVATLLRAAISGLNKPTKDMSALFESLGVSSGKALVAQHGLKGALDLVVDAAEKSGQPIANLIAREEGQILALALAGAQSDVFSSKMAAMGNVMGATGVAFEAQTEGVNALGFQWDQLKQRMVVTQQRIGDALMPALSALLDHINPLISSIEGWSKKFGELEPKTQAIILGVAAAAAAIGPLIAGIGFLVTGIAPLVAGFGSVVASIAGAGGLLAVLTGPVGITVAVAALVAAFLVTSGKTTEIWDAIKDKISGVLDVLKSLFGTVTDSFKSIWETHGDTLTSVFQVAWDAISGVVSGAITAIEGIITGALTILQGALKIVTGALTGDWDTFAGGFEDVFSGLFTAIEGILTGAVEILKSALGLVVDALSGGWTTFTDNFKATWDGLWGGIETVVTTAQTLVEAAVGLVTTALDTAWTTFVDGLKGDWDDLWSGIETVVTDAKALIDAALSVLTTGIDTAWTAFTGGIRAAWEGLWDTLRSFISDEDPNTFTPLDPKQAYQLLGRSIDSF